MCVCNCLILDEVKSAKIRAEIDYTSGTVRIAVVHLNARDDANITMNTLFIFKLFTCVQFLFQNIIFFFYFCSRKMFIGGLSWQTSPGNRRFFFFFLIYAFFFHFTQPNENHRQNCSIFIIIIIFTQERTRPCFISNITTLVAYVCLCTSCVHVYTHFNY